MNDTPQKRCSTSTDTIQNLGYPTLMEEKQWGQLTRVIGRVLRVGHPLQDLEGHGLFLGVGAHVDVDGGVVDLRPGPLLRLASVVRLHLARWWLAADGGHAVGLVTNNYVGLFSLMLPTRTNEKQPINQPTQFKYIYRPSYGQAHFRWESMRNKQRTNLPYQSTNPIWMIKRPLYCQAHYRWEPMRNKQPTNLPINQPNLND